MADLMSSCHQAPVRWVYGDPRTTGNYLECTACGREVTMPNSDAAGCTSRQWLTGCVVFFLVCVVVIGGAWVWFYLATHPQSG